MESGDHFKNGARPKSQMSRGKRVVLVSMLACISFFCNAQYLKFGELYSIADKTLKEAEEYLLSKDFYMEKRQSQESDIYDYRHERRLKRMEIVTYYYRKNYHVCAFAVMSNKVYHVRYYISSATNWLDEYKRQILKFGYYTKFGPGTGSGDYVGEINYKFESANSNLSIINLVELYYAPQQTVVDFELKDPKGYCYPNSDLSYGHTRFYVFKK
ncbi:MAG: hypothetical protein LBB53_01685 [Prevotellaceae bacterium]|nr:hypothetical protein [Prevotellaceae bacterium]